MKIKNIFLTLSLTAFAIGFSNLQENLLFWMGPPVGAILFGLYMIFSVLEDATALLDQQEKEKWARVNLSNTAFRSSQRQEVRASESQFEAESIAN